MAHNFGTKILTFISKRDHCTLLNFKKAWAALNLGFKHIYVLSEKEHCTAEKDKT